MKINIISTENGKNDEGMRNIATHTAECLEKLDRVKICRSQLSSPIVCVKNALGSEASVIFARGTKKTALLAKVIVSLRRRVYFVLVQPPEDGFIETLGVDLYKLSYFAVTPGDAASLTSRGIGVKTLPVGIDTNKFSPPSSDSEVSALRKKYGIADDRLLVVHVGHLSTGRGLETFLELDRNRFERLVVASGMFSGGGVRQTLERDGVRVIAEYVSHIEEIYRMADVYLFPTVDQSFVISIPLSVTEALACGTPAVCLRGIAGLSLIDADESSLTVLDSTEALADAIERVATLKSRQSLLRSAQSWDDTAAAVLAAIAEEAKK